MNLFHDTKIEAQILGQILIDSEALLTISEILKTTDFYDKQNGVIYDTIQDLFLENKGIDIITVSEELKKRGNNISAYEVAGLTEGIASASHIEYHARIIKDFSTRRRMLIEIERLKQIGSSAESDLDAFISSAAVFTDKVLGELDSKTEIKEFKDNIIETIQSIQDRQQGKEVKFGVKPALIAEKEFVNIWLNGALIVVAARPGMGKTAWTVFELSHIAKTAGPVLYFSLEVHKRAITGRILQGESGLSNYDFANMQQDQWTTLDDAATQLMDLNFFIDDTPTVSSAYIKSKAKLFKKRHGLKAIAIDYLQLMEVDKSIKNREQQISEISRQMKLLARELDIPVFLVAQLNRGPESRKEDACRPRMSDLRESGAIEQNADYVIFPHRPSYYLPNEPEFKGIVELIIAKQREGKTGIAEIMVNDTITKFYDPTPDYANYGDYNSFNNA